jgi:hypothetical protein
MRQVYKWGRPVAYLVLLASPLEFFAWIGSSSSSGPKTASVTVNTCAGRPQPREGVYRWYGPVGAANNADLSGRSLRSSAADAALGLLYEVVRARFFHVNDGGQAVIGNVQQQDTQVEERRTT